MSCHVMLCYVMSCYVTGYTELENATGGPKAVVLAVLSFQMGPDRPSFKSYCVLDPKLAVGTRPDSFRATFRPPKKSATGKITSFALQGCNRFTKPSWVRAHGLIFGESYIVWVCAPRYRPLSSPRSRIRENSALKFGPNFVTHSGGIFLPVVFFDSVHPVVHQCQMRM